MTRATLSRCRILAVALVAGAMLAGGRATAQTTQPGQTDARWQAWEGCWAPVRAASFTVGDSIQPQLVCVVPAGASAVEVASVNDGQIVERDRVDASGVRETSATGGCSGWTSADWSADGRRVYLHSRYTCPNGLERTSSGMYAISPAGEWLDIRGVGVGKSSGVRVARYRPAPVPASLRDTLAAVEGQDIATATARQAAGAAPSVAAVEDVSKHVDAGVAEAWLIERHQSFAVDAKELTRLADAGVPARVIDAMVALSYPRRFAIASALPGGALGPGVALTGSGGMASDSSNGVTIPVTMYPYGYSPYGYDPYAYSSGFGYFPYGSPYGYYPFGGPVIVVNPPPASTPPAVRGHAVNGRGYTRADAGSSGQGTMSPSGGSAGASTTRTATPTSSSPPRTAKPRP